MALGIIALLILFGSSRLCSLSHTAPSTLCRVAPSRCPWYNDEGGRRYPWCRASLRVVDRVATSPRQAQIHQPFEFASIRVLSKTRYQGKAMMIFAGPPLSFVVPNGVTRSPSQLPTFCRKARPSPHAQNLDQGAHTRSRKTHNATFRSHYSLPCIILLFS
jgi:hypothetical protein